MNTGSNIMDNSGIMPINLSSKASRGVADISFQTPNPNKIMRHDGPTSFNKLGFAEDPRRDPDFNPHHEYNMRKVPRRNALNNSVESLRSITVKNNRDSERDHINRIRNQVNMTQLDHSKM